MCPNSNDMGSSKLSDGQTALEVLAPFVSLEWDSTILWPFVKWLALFFSWMVNAPSKTNKIVRSHRLVWSMCSGWQQARWGSNCLLFSLLNNMFDSFASSNPCLSSPLEMTECSLAIGTKHSSWSCCHAQNIDDLLMVEATIETNSASLFVACFSAAAYFVNTSHDTGLGTKEWAIFFQAASMLMCSPCFTDGREDIVFEYSLALTCCRCNVRRQNAFLAIKLWIGAIRNFPDSSE